MLRITTESRPEHVVLTFEGRLSGAWVAEADARWTEANATRDGRAVIVDLRDLLGLDADGRALLARMQQAGAELRVCGCAMRELVRELRSAVDRRDAAEGSRV